MKCNGCQVEFPSNDLFENPNRCKNCLKLNEFHSEKRNNFKRTSPESEDFHFDSLKKNSGNATEPLRRSARLNSNRNSNGNICELKDDATIGRNTRNIRSKLMKHAENRITENSSTENSNNESINNNNDDNNLNNHINTESHNFTSTDNNSYTSTNNDQSTNINDNNNSSDPNPNINPNPQTNSIDSGNRSSPIFSFSFGFARLPLSLNEPIQMSPITSLGATTVPLARLPPDIQLLFNNISNGNNNNNEDTVGINGFRGMNINVDDITRMFRRASNHQSTGNTIPDTEHTRSSTNSNTTEDSSNTNRSPLNTSALNPEHETNFLGFAHQMFQLISSMRSSQVTHVSQAQANPNPRILHSFISLPIMNEETSFSNNFNIESGAADIENVLNEFFSRIFGGLEATRGPIGLTPEKIANLPETPSSDFDFDCSICRETVTNQTEGEKEKCVQLPCKHNFHFECIDPWLRRVPSCPICRSKIE